MARNLPHLPIAAPAALVLALTLLAGCASSSPPPRGLPVFSSVHETDGGADEPAPDLTERPRLAELLRVALERSPRIEAARQRALAAAESPVVEGWLPDPKVMVGWYETAVETRVGPQEYSLGVQQAIPFPTKLATKAAIGEAGARRARVAYERTVRDVLTEVVKGGHEIAYLDRALAITEEIAALLERYVAAASDGETGSPLPELFRAETQRAQLENDRVTLAEMRAAEVSRLRSLLAIGPAVPIGTPDLPEPPPVDASFAELLAAAEAGSPELEIARIEREAASLRTDLARQTFLPDVTLGVTRIFTDELDPALGMDPAGNGKDPVILSAGIRIPLWVHRDLAAIRQAQASERAAAADHRDRAQRLREALARAFFRVGNSDRLVRLYDEILVPRALAAARTAEDLMAAGKGSLSGALETIAVTHNFRLALARARADRGRAIADLESLIGRPFAAEGSSDR